MLLPVGTVAGSPAPPFELGGFRIGEVLGEGGSGTVYAATLDDDECEVALKVLRADLALTESEVRRFLAEAALMERISHPSIVPVLRSGLVADGRPYLVMPRLVGETLAARLRRGRLAMPEALACFDQLAGAVATLHAAGIIHRDLKPENIFLVDGTRVVLLDFGIAKDADAGPSTTTTEGRVRGTPAYMAPERFFGAAASIRSDVYELAVSLYEMLVGALPWSNPDDASARLDPRGGDLPAPVWSVLRLALASTTQLRPASATELSAAVHAAATATHQPGGPKGRRTVTLDGAPSPVVAVPVVEPAPARRARVVATAVGATVLASAVVAVLVMRSEPQREPNVAAVQVAVDSRGGFCQQLVPRPAFCADFGGSGDFRTGFYNAGKTPDPGELGGGTVRASEPRAPSGSRSAELTIPPLVTATSKASAVLIAELASPIRYAVVTMNLRIDTELFAEERAVAMLVTLTFGRAGAINFSRKQAGTQVSVYEGTSSVDKAMLSSPLPVGAWKTLKLLIHNYAVGPDGRGEVIVLLDGLAAKLPLPVSLQQADILPRLSVGIPAARGPMETLRIHVDDVAVTLYDGPGDAAAAAMTTDVDATTDPRR